MTNYKLLLMNELMEIILMPDLSTEQYSKTVTRLNELYSCLTEAGKEHIDLWAEDHDRSNFKFYLEKR